MKKDELKNILRPLIKECIKEIIFEEGTLSAIISEVVRGTSQTQPIVEVKKPKRSRGAVKDVDPGDSGVDISNIFSGHSSAIWKKLSGKNDV